MASALHIYLRKQRNLTICFRFQDNQGFPNMSAYHVVFTIIIQFKEYISSWSLKRNIKETLASYPVSAGSEVTFTRYSSIYPRTFLSVITKRYPELVLNWCFAANADTLQLGHMIKESKLLLA